MFKDFKVVGRTTVDDWREDPTTMSDFEDVMNYFRTSQARYDNSTFSNTDPAEMLRDDFLKIESSLLKASALKDAPDDIKEKYSRLRQGFNRSEIGSFKEGFDATVDYAADGVFNYGNALYALATLGSGLVSGPAGPAATTTARLGAGAAASAQLSQALRTAAPVVNNALSSRKGVSLFEAGLAGSAAAGTQTLEMELGERQSYNPYEIATHAVAGGALTYGGSYLLEGLGHQVNKYFTRRRTEDLSEDVSSMALEEATITNPSTGATINYTETINKTPEELAEFFDIDIEDVNRLDDAFIQDLFGSVGANLRIIREEAGQEANDSANDTLLRNLVGEVESFVNSRGKEATPEEIASLASVRKFVDELGGGTETLSEVVDNILASARQTPSGTVGSKLLFNLKNMSSEFLSGLMFGKSAGFLSAVSDLSPTAKALQEVSSTEFAMTTVPGQQKLIANDFAENIRVIRGVFTDMYHKAVSPISKTSYNTKLATEVNDALSLALRGQASKDQLFSRDVNFAASQIRKAYEDVAELLESAGLIVPIKDYYPRQWKRSAIENNRTEFKNLLVKEGEAADLNEAEKIVEEMLSKAYQLNGGTQRYFFSTNRRFENIKNDYLFEKFLNTDVKETYFQYMQQAAMALAKQKTFGVNNADEFNVKWIKPIQGELEAAGLTSNQIQAVTNRSMSLYRTLTGEGEDFAQKELLGSPMLNRALNEVTQGMMLGSRMALLPLAPLSSITEILLTMGVAGGNNFAKGLKRAGQISKAKFKEDVSVKAKELGEFIPVYNSSFRSITDDLHSRYTDEFGLTNPEAWREMQKYGLVLEQNLASMADRLAGEELASTTMAKASNWFFRVTMLDQWTKLVQNGSFQSAKMMFREHLQKIAQHGDAPETKRIRAMKDDLAEFGLDLNKGLEWLSGGANKNAPFYEDITKSAARFSNQIILQPDRTSGLRPRAHYTRAGVFWTQLLAYPTAFTNNILKRGAKRLVRDVRAKDKINAEKLVPTAILMTAVAGATNYIRARGEGYEDKEPLDITFEALARWGGNGLPLDTFQRASKNAGYTGVAGIPGAFLGPAYSDTLEFFRYGKPVSLIGKKVPFYGAGRTVFGEETMQEYKEFLGDVDEELKELIGEPKTSSPYAKGGVVNVPQAPEEPDERVDKMTGLPYNIQAGEAFIDEEDQPKSLLARIE